MKAFVVGLIFLIGLGALVGVGFLLYPLFVILGWFAQFLVIFLLVIACIWGLGKVVIFIWKELIKK